MKQQQKQQMESFPFFASHHASCVNEVLAHSHDKQSLPCSSFGDNSGSRDTNEAGHIMLLCRDRCILGDSLQPAICCANKHRSALCCHFSSKWKQIRNFQQTCSRGVKKDLLCGADSLSSHLDQTLTDDRFCDVLTRCVCKLQPQRN